MAGITCIDLFGNNIVSVQKGTCEVGRLVNINDIAVFNDVTQKDILHLLMSRVRSIDLDHSPTRKGDLSRSLFQIRIFAVPNGPLGISVSSSLDGLVIIDSKSLLYFMPGDIITAVNDMNLRCVSAELAVHMFSESSDRHLTVLRKLSEGERDSSSKNEETNDIKLSECCLVNDRLSGVYKLYEGGHQGYINKLRRKFIMNSVASSSVFHDDY